jgi:hypothetical protein
MKSGRVTLSRIVYTALVRDRYIAPNERRRKVIDAAAQKWREDKQGKVRSMIESALIEVTGNKCLVICEAPEEVTA